MSDAVSSVSALGAFAPIYEPNSESGAPRSINSKEKDLANTDQTELDALLSDFAVHAALTGFIMTRDEMRRQNELVVARLKEAQEESE